MHPFGATVAEECVSLFMYDLRTLALETQAHVPSYARWLETADMAPAYAQHRAALQTLQSRQPTERWILKTPEPPVAPRRAGRLLPGRPDHLDPPRARDRWSPRWPAWPTPVNDRSPRAPIPARRRRSGSASATFALGSAMAYDDAHAGRVVRAPALRRPDRRSGGRRHRAVRGSSARRSATCTRGACGRGSTTALRTPSAATATTRPTSAGPTTAGRRVRRLQPPLPGGLTDAPGRLASPAA